MIEIKQTKEHEYLILQNEDEIGTINTYKNSFHNKNCYLQLNLQKYDLLIVKELFSKLMKIIQCPMQIMMSSEEVEKIVFLERGGFFCKRKCYEVEVQRGDYIKNRHQKIDANFCKRGCREYEKACELLYGYYAKSHESISPLTVDISTFSKKLPELVYYEERDDEIVNAAFVEEEEIAYVCTRDAERFEDFIKNIVELLFMENEGLFFECDDCDWAAMKLLSLFDIKVEESYNTYIRK